MALLSGESTPESIGGQTQTVIMMKIPAIQQRNYLISISRLINVALRLIHIPQKNIFNRKSSFVVEKSAETQLPITIISNKSQMTV